MHKDCANLICFLLYDVHVMDVCIFGNDGFMASTWDISHCCGAVLIKLYRKSDEKSLIANK